MNFVIFTVGIGNNRARATFLYSVGLTTKTKPQCLINCHTSRHTVVCQQPRKPCGTQVCYLQEPLTCCFQPLISLQPLYRFLSNSHILCPPYTRPHIPNLKEIGPVGSKIYVPENCPIFFTFFFLFIIIFFFTPFYKSSFEPTKDSLPVDQLLSNLAHLSLKFGDV